MDIRDRKVIKDRQEHLSPLTHLVSAVSLSFALFLFLQYYNFSLVSLFPVIIFTLMVVPAFNRQFGRMPPRFSSPKANPAPSARSETSHSSSSYSVLSSGSNSAALTSTASSSSSLSSSYPNSNHIRNNGFSSIPHSFSSFFSGLPFSSSVVSPDRQTLLNVVAGLDAYKERTQSMISRRFALFSKMSFKHRELASSVGYLERLAALESKVSDNQRILQAISLFAFDLYNIRESELRLAKPISNTTVIELLHHLVRDWSHDTVEQRNILFKPILTALNKEFPISLKEQESLLIAAQSAACTYPSDPKHQSSKWNTDPFPVPKTSRSSLNVLIPGSGLARLAYETSRMGFQTDALEYSCLMDIAAKFVFTFPEKLTFSESDLPATYFDFYPYIHDFSHQVSGEFQARSSLIPEFHIPEYLIPANININTNGTCNGSEKVVKRENEKKVTNSEDVIMKDTVEKFQSQHPLLRIPSTLSLGYGDFTQLPQEPSNFQRVFNHSHSSAPTSSHSSSSVHPTSSNVGKYDAVATLFLIDTAENALSYIEAIHKLLKPNGIWINYGPLKWGTAPQVEFTLEELEMVIEKMGFAIETRWEGENEYNGDPKSLWQGIYKIRGWTARKRVI